MNLNKAQQEALEARGNVLLVAGAGTGKTRTLVERCLHCLLEETPRASIDEMLMVTFTDAAAAEMRQRIRERLEEELKLRPDDSHCQEQLALFETAHIGTLHSFCLELVRQHFHVLEIDPQVTVLREEESYLLIEEQMDKLFQDCYSGRHPRAKAVQALIQDYGAGSDQPIRLLVRRLHDYSQTVPNPMGWFEAQQKHFAATQPADWQEWLSRGIAGWRESWLPLLRKLCPGNEVAQRASNVIEALGQNATRDEAATALERIITSCADCPHGKKGEWIKPLETFQAEAEFLASLAKSDEVDPLVEDWGWIREQMSTLLGFAVEFGSAFTEAKRELGLLDFHDLEQFALRLLWDFQADAPTEIAQEWRQTFRHVFVDEYQDINAAQDKIIQALSRDAADAANRFLVGDVKQSIYRFRLADPRIFQTYARDWRTAQSHVIPLVENFRSREGLLKFINSLFSRIMQDALGGVAYEPEAHLHFGATEKRRSLSLASDASPRVELHLRIKGGRGYPEPEDEPAHALAEINNLEEPDKEARLIGLRLLQLHAKRHQIWDETRFRPMRWSDVAVLLRAPAAKAESYAKEFSKLDIPLEVARLGFYETREISDLLALLQILDNPLQVLPVLAVLHSPLVGLTIDELALIRLARRGRFWSALIKWNDDASGGDIERSMSVRLPQHLKGEALANLRARVSRFLKRYSRWRNMARQMPLSKCLEAVLAETHYASWLLTQRGGEQRHANVQQLLRLAQQFDRFQRQGLFRFLAFTKAQREAEADPGVAALGQKDSVRLMSIHQSKGLEFPVVVLADLGKSFNLSDLRGEVILDEQYGLCPQVKPPHSGKRYPSLPFWLARRRELPALLGEELRLLYVGMTRAQDTLLLSATVPEHRFAKMWKRSDALTPLDLASARSYADWLGLWFAHLSAGHAADPQERVEAMVSWFLHDESTLTVEKPKTEKVSQRQAPFYESNPNAWLEVQERIAWRYPHNAASLRPAKTTVSMIRRRRAALEDTDAAPFALAAARPAGARGQVAARFTRPGQAAIDAGTVHHTFLQLVSLECVGSVDQLRAEADRLVAAGNLSKEEVDLLKFEAIAHFWSSGLGNKIRSQPKFVRRELPFTARFYEAELAAITGEAIDPELAKEFVVVQGIADLVVLLAQEIWLVDFKTDSVTGSDVNRKVSIYEPQLQLYAAALSRIYQRPVTHSWLYFLSGGNAVEVKVPQTVP
jgi:ATP-dependent helicase/nuclease subunit A